MFCNYDQRGQYNYSLRVPTKFDTRNIYSLVDVKKESGFLKPFSRMDIWKSCPKDMSKSPECLPLRDQVLQVKSANPSNVDEGRIQLNSRLADKFSQAVRACKHICIDKCNSFNIKKRKFGLGYTCEFFSSIVVLMTSPLLVKKQMRTIAHHVHCMNRKIVIMSL